MLPKFHIILGAIFSALMYYLLQITLFQTILIFFASILIDFDHYLFYVQETKKWSLQKAYNWKIYRQKKHKPIMMIFHTIEFLILVFILSFVWKGFGFILIGLVFHSIFDMIQLGYEKKLYIREFSLIRFLLRDKKNYF